MSLPKPSAGKETRSLRNIWNRFVIKTSRKVSMTIPKPPSASTNFKASKSKTANSSSSPCRPNRSIRCEGRSRRTSLARWVKKRGGNRRSPLAFLLRPPPPMLTASRCERIRIYWFFRYGLLEGFPFGYERLLPDELPLELLRGEVAPPVAEFSLTPKLEKLLCSHPGCDISVSGSKAG